MVTLNFERLALIEQSLIYFDCYIREYYKTGSFGFYLLQKFMSTGGSDQIIQIMPDLLSNTEAQ